MNKENSKKLSVEVLVVYHKDTLIVNKEGYVPIHVGAESSKIYLPILRDDSSLDNISKLNPEFCELTATYWAWKNSKADIIGINHYRRVFTDIPGSKRENIKYLVKKFLLNNLKFSINQKSNFIRKADFNFENLSSNRIKKIIDNKTLIVPDKFYLNTSVKDHFLYYGEFILILQEIVSKSSSDKFNKIFLFSLNKKYLYPCNVIIAERDVFKEYCEMIFPLLFEHYYLCKSKDMQYDRIAGFMGEVLTNAFVLYKQQLGYRLRSYKLAILE